MSCATLAERWPTTSDDDRRRHERGACSASPTNGTARSCRSGRACGGGRSTRRAISLRPATRKTFIVADYVDLYRYDHLDPFDFPPVFGALRQIARERRIWIYIEKWFGRRGGEDRGLFVTKDDELSIYVRTRRWDEAIDDVFDSMILAHEMGHHLSHLNGESSDEMNEIMRTTPERIKAEGPRLPRHLREEVVAEEIRAWNHARADLRTVGFGRWPLFERLASASVAKYIHGLELTDASASRRATRRAGPR